MRIRPPKKAGTASPPSRQFRTPDTVPPRQAPPVKRLGILRVYVKGCQQLCALLHCGFQTKGDGPPRAENFHSAASAQTQCLAARRPVVSALRRSQYPTEARGAL